MYVNNKILKFTSSLTGNQYKSILKNRRNLIIFSGHTNMSCRGIQYKLELLKHTFSQIKLKITLYSGQYERRQKHAPKFQQIRA